MNKAKLFFVTGHVFQGLGNMIFLAGFLFRLQAWPFSSFMLIGGLAFFVVGFLLYRLGTTFQTAELEAKRREVKSVKFLPRWSKLFIITGFAIILLSIGFVFLGYAGSSYLLLGGFMLTEVGILFNYIDKVLRELGIEEKESIDTLDEDMMK